MKPPFSVPRATYRVQLHSGFSFEQLAEIIPYLDGLGISDVYASPIFRAGPGSMHGYDICDHNEINPELGGIDGLIKISDLLQQRGMGLIVDFVPNHMGTDVPYNWRWMDVLEHGHLSRFASFFDIQWNSRQTLLQGRILVPILHDFYGRVLEAGDIQLKYEKAAFWIYYRTQRFPLRPESYTTILQKLAWLRNPRASLSQKLERMAEQFGKLPRPSANESTKEAQERNHQSHGLRHELAGLMETDGLSSDLEEVLAVLNGKPEDPASFDNLHQVLEEQNYRLAFWKSGTHEINYRRFFAIDTLVGLNVESPAVFEESHRLLQHLIEKGVVTGVRVDHIDGLWDPDEYLQRLARLGRREQEPIYLLVEKILTQGESLAPEWAVHGTSGYDFASSLINLFIEARSEPAFTTLYRKFTGMKLDPDEQAYDLKLFIMEELFPSVIDTLVKDLEEQVKSDRRWRDWTVNDLRRAVSRIIACLSVYRTYQKVGQKLNADDVAMVAKAVGAALERNRSSDSMPFLFILDLWTGRYPDMRSVPELKTWSENWICKLQQFTGAIMAKSVEDTLFYRYVRLFATNEVGHHPSEFGRPISHFHESNELRQQYWPAGMLSTSTHDTKMSEDVRSRLLALSEIPDRWTDLLRRWSAGNQTFKTRVRNLSAPDSNEEYLLYQILLGAWPLDERQVDDVFRGRIKNYMRKALSESKANTNWVNPNQEWVKACDNFIDALLNRQRSPDFWESFLPLARDLAWRGMNLSLAQVVLKLTSPGVPDFYQGNELWDFSLVDPDNRRPVDYALRLSALQDVDRASVQDLYKFWKDGRIKMRVLRDLLQYRREHPELFFRGSYIPLTITGRNADYFVSFLRQHEKEQILVVAFRHLGDDKTVDLAKICENATLTVPTASSIWRNLFSQCEITEQLTEIPLHLLLNNFPAAVFRGADES